MTVTDDADADHVQTNMLIDDDALMLLTDDDTLMLLTDDDALMLLTDDDTFDATNR